VVHAVHGNFPTWSAGFARTTRPFERLVKRARPVFRVEKRHAVALKLRTPLDIQIRQILRRHRKLDLALILVLTDLPPERDREILAFRRRQVWKVDIVQLLT
jgi:hypothetical protein